jgi:hypothetical protein
MSKEKIIKEKSTRGNASQLFVAGQLCRRGYSAVVTLGKTPNTDILCSNIEGTKFIHIQVKTYVPGIRTCSVGRKAEKDFGLNFFWILGGIPKWDSEHPFKYYIIPSAIMAKNVKEKSDQWLATPGKKGQEHKNSNVRIVMLPPFKSDHSWSVEGYQERWDLIEEKLGVPQQ